MAQAGISQQPYTFMLPVRCFAVSHSLPRPFKKLRKNTQNLLCTKCMTSYLKYIRTKCTVRCSTFGQTKFAVSHSLPRHFEKIEEKHTKYMCQLCTKCMTSYLKYVHTKCMTSYTQKVNIIKVSSGIIGW